MGTLASDLAGLLEAPFQTLPFQSRAFLVVTTAVLVLVFLSILFSLYAIWLRARNALRARMWADREARWTDLTLEAVAGERSVEEVVAKVRPLRTGRLSFGDERLPFLDFLLRYARRLSGRERDRVRELAVPFLFELERRLKDQDPYRRARAVQSLGALGLPHHDDTLVRAVQDDSPVVSMLAARALASKGGAKYAGPILENLHRFEHWGSDYVRSLLVSLGPAAAPQLREVMRDERRSTRIRVLATDALRSLHDLDAVSPAAEILSEGPEPDLAAAILRMFAVLGGPEQVELVKSFLEHPHFAVRAAAYSALGALGADGGGLLEEGLEDSSPWVALHAARGMREQGARARLLELAESSHPGAVAAAQVLAEE